MVESSTYPQHERGSRWRTCEVSTLYLENWANACRIYVFWVINPLFSRSLGYVESSTPPRPAPRSPWPVWEVWTSYLENCANARRIDVFQVINPLFSTPPGVRYNRQPSRNLYLRVVDVPVNFQLCILKTGQMHVEFTFFEWLTPFILMPPGVP